MGVTIVIPCFNEASTIGALLEQIPATIAGHALTTVVVDDGSSDNTAELVRQAAVHYPIRLISQPHNEGKSAALCRAMDEIRSDHFDALVWMDGDGQHQPSSLPALVAPVLNHQVALCVGSRYLAMKDEATGNPDQDEARPRSRAPLNRRLVRKLTISAIRSSTGLDVTDPFSGLRCFSRTGFAALCLRGNGYEAELDSLFSVAEAGLSFNEVPVPRIYGPATSKMGYHHGAFRGRIAVLSGYAQTIHLAKTRTTQIGTVAVHG